MFFLHVWSTTWNGSSPVSSSGIPVIMVSNSYLTKVYSMNFHVCVCGFFSMLVNIGVGEMVILFEMTSVFWSEL